MTLSMILNKVLRKILAERNIKPSQLAKATGISVQTLHNWLGGQAPRKIDQVKLVADHLHLSLDFLLYGVHAPESVESVQQQIDAGVYRVILIPEKKRK